MSSIFPRAKSWMIRIILRPFIIFRMILSCGASYLSADKFKRRISAKMLRINTSHAYVTRVDHGIIFLSRLRAFGMLEHSEASSPTGTRGQCS